MCAIRDDCGSDPTRAGWRQGAPRGRTTGSYRVSASRSFEKESRLLRLCARQEAGPELAAQVQALLREDLDWGFVLQSASRHEIAPLVSRSLVNLDRDRRVPRKARTVLGIIEDHTRRD